MKAGGIGGRGGDRKQKEFEEGEKIGGRVGVRMQERIRDRGGDRRQGDRRQGDRRQGG